MIRAYRSAVISAPVQKVWAAIRDFNALPAWHPAIVQSEIERGLASDAIGCVRSFSLQDGGHLREQLLALSDVDHSFTYNILVSPMPVKNYVATFRLTPITVGNRTFVEWWADFNVTSGTERRWPRRSTTACSLPGSKRRKRSQSGAAHHSRQASQL